MKFSLFERILFILAVVIAIWPFFESYRIAATSKPKAAFYQGMIFWSFTANYCFIFSGTLLLGGCTVGWLLLERSGFVAKGQRTLYLLISLLALALSLYGVIEVRLNQEALNHILQQ